MSSLMYHIPGVRQLQAKLNQLTSYVPPPPRVAATQGQESLKILLVHAHPDPVNSYSAAIAKQVETSAKEAGHEVRRISLYKTSTNSKARVDDYQPKLTAQEHAHQHARGTNVDQRDLAPEIKEYVRLLQWCDTLVFVYPTWWMNTPAALKGFFDRALVHDLCWSLPNTVTNPDQSTSTTGLIPKLTNISQIVGISTYGAPWHIVTLAGDNGRRMIANAIRPITSPSATVAWLGLYGMDETTNVQRTDFLKEVDNMVKRL